MNFDDHTRYAVLLLAALSSLLIACVPVVQLQDGRQVRVTSDEYREYAASVFRRQNAASVALIELLDAVEVDNSSLAQQISDADAALQRDCADLNAAAIARRDGQEVDHSVQRQLIATIPQCEVSTADAEALLAAAERL